MNVHNPLARAVGSQIVVRATKDQTIVVFVCLCPLDNFSEVVSLHIEIKVQAA